MKIYFNNEQNDSGDAEVATTKPELETKEPPKFKILMLNDDYSTMEFVVHVLKKFFKKTSEQAQGLMLKVHHEGRAVCGIYTHEVAETKCLKVNRYSKDKGHPLKCTIEPCH